MAARLLDKFKRVFPFALLLVYLAQFAAFIIALGGFERYVRSTDLMPTLAAVEMMGEGQGQSLYDLNAQHEAQERLLYPYKSLQEGEVLPFNHLPFEALLISPFRSLSYTGMTVTWTLLSALALGAALFILQRILPVHMPWLIVLVGCVLSYQPLFRAFVLGQNSMFVLLGLVLAYAASRERSTHLALLAGAGLLLVALKPQIVPLVLLLLLLEGRWKSLLWFCGLFVLLVVLCMPLLGWDWPIHFLRLLLQVSTWQDGAAINPAIMHNWRGFAVNTVGRLSPAAGTIMFVALTLLSILLFVYAKLKSTEPVGSDLWWALVVVTALLISPHVNPHDLTLLILPGWIIVYCVQHGVFPARLGAIWSKLLVALYLLVAVAFFVRGDSPVWVILHVSLLAAAIALLLVSLNSLQVTRFRDTRLPTL